MIIPDDVVLDAPELLNLEDFSNNSVQKKLRESYLEKKFQPIIQ
jgi:hypothetical protein